MLRPAARALPAAGFLHGAIGTDTGGSIRLPCAANGLTGVKPTWGRVSRYGIYNAAASLDHLGPMARSARDAAAMLGVIAGRDHRDPTASLLPVPDYFNRLSCDLSRFRLGIDWSWIETVSDDDTHKVIEQAIETLCRLGIWLNLARRRMPQRSSATGFPCALSGSQWHMPRHSHYTARNTARRWLACWIWVPA